LAASRTRANASTSSPLTESPWRALWRRARLRAFSAGLRALELRDADLRAAVERYHASIDGLAEAYAGIALPQAPGDGGVDGGDGERGLVTLGAVLSTHGAALNGARSAISRACAGR